MASVSRERERKNETWVMYDAQLQIKGKLIHSELLPLQRDITV